MRRGRQTGVVVLALILGCLFSRCYRESFNSLYGSQSEGEQRTAGVIALAELPEIGVLPLPSVVTATITDSGVSMQPPRIPPGTVEVVAINQSRQIQMLGIQGGGITEITPAIPVGGRRTLLLYGVPQGNYVVTAPLTGMQPATFTAQGNPAQNTQPVASKVTIYITDREVLMTPSQILPGAVYLAVTNTSNESKQVTISGPGDVNLSTQAIEPLSGNDMLIVPSTMTGTYDIRVSEALTTLPDEPQHRTLTVAPTARISPYAIHTGRLFSATVMVMDGQVMLTPDYMQRGTITLHLNNVSPKAVDIVPIGPLGSLLIGVELPPGVSSQLTIFRTVHGQVYPILAAPSQTPILAGSNAILKITDEEGRFTPEATTVSGGATEEAGEL